MNSLRAIIEQAVFCEEDIHLPRYFTHYWRNTSVDEYVRIHGHRALVNVVYGDDRLLGVRTGDCLYEVTVKKGILYLLGRLEVKRVGKRTDWRPYPGQTAQNTQGYEAEAVQPMALHTDITVPPSITRQIECVTKEGPRELVFTQADALDRQTLRIVRELTADSATLLDRIIANYGDS